MRLGLAITASILVAVLAATGLLVIAIDESDPPADPLAEVPPDQRPEYVRATEPCESHPDTIEPPPPEGWDARLELRLSGLLEPTTVDFLDSDTAFVGLRGGSVLRWELEDDSTREVIDLTSTTGTENDQGLVGLTVSPDRGHLYVQHTLAESASRIVAYPLVDGTPVQEAEVEILKVDQPSRLHNGGSIVFDGEGYMWASFGDGGGLGDRYENGQDPDTLLGSILRMQVDPAGNPPVGPAPTNPGTTGSGIHELAFAIGVRNPYRISYDDQTGEMWVAELGQQCVEEINVLDPDTEAGANLGWRVFEGTRHFLGELEGVHREPDFEYWHGGGYCAIVGGEVYRGSSLELLDGMYVFADWCRNELLVFDPATGTAHETGVAIVDPTGFGSDPEGELYAVSIAGTVSKLVQP